MKLKSVLRVLQVFTLDTVPSASPENVKVQLLNLTSAQVLWHPPPRRELHGDLKGYKVIVDEGGSSDKEDSAESNNAAPFANFTLEAGANSVSVNGLSPGTVYRVRAAAYNRQGVGPFSEPVLIRVSEEQLRFFEQHEKNLKTPATTAAAAAALPPSAPASNDETEDVLPPPSPPDVVSPELAPGLELVLQELWFVIVASLVCVVLIVAVVAVVCLRRKRKAVRMMEKNMSGHYNGKNGIYSPFYFIPLN